MATVVTQLAAKSNLSGLRLPLPSVQPRFLIGAENQCACYVGTCQSQDLSRFYKANFYNMRSVERSCPGSLKISKNAQTSPGKDHRQALDYVPTSPGSVKSAPDMIYKIF